MAQAAAGIKSATDAINDIRGDLFNEGRATFTQIRQTAAITAKLAGEMREVIRHAVTLTKHADQLAVRFDDVVTNNNKELRQLLVNLSEASRHLKETVSTLKDDPSEIVWGKNLPEKEIPDK